MKAIKFFIFLFGTMALSYYFSGIFWEGFERGLSWGIMHLASFYMLVKSDANAENDEEVRE